MKDKKLEKIRQDYENIKIPRDLQQKVEAEIQRAKKETQMNKKAKVIMYSKRIVGGIGAALLLITVMANSGSAVAHAMAEIPVIGTLAKVVTFREYKSFENNMEANIKIPEVRVTKEDGTENKEATQKVNQSIQEFTDAIIAQYEADVKAVGEGEGYLNVELDYSVITDNDRLFSIRFDQLLIMASGAQMVKIYHIDKQTGELLNLAGLFKEGADYVTPISENIKEQMRELMAADESMMYFLDSDIPENDFQSVKEDNTFYINEKGKLTIVFDEYEVAPGYMGSVEFKIPTEVVQDLVQEGFLK